MSRSNSPKNSELVRRKSQKNDIPFYEPPSNAPTSSQIIKAAKEKLHDAKRNQVAYLPESANLARTLNSNRPFTPRDDKRTLFGPKSTRPINERPPSSFSIGSKSFEADPTASRPISATRLSPIEAKNSSKLTFSTQTSLESESRSSLRNEDTDLLKLSSPKSASRLAPLEKSTDKLKIKDDDDDKNQSKKQDTKTNDKIDLTWKKIIEPLVNQMEVFFKNNQIDLFCESSDLLNQLVCDNQMYSKSCSKRSLILKILFKYLDTESDKIKLKISRIILNMKITGSNLTNICRLLFSISRNSENDLIFMDPNILETLLNIPERFDFKENSDTVIYFCGTIKNLSENIKILKALSSKNLEEILVRMIKDLSKYFKDTETLKAETGHALVQITATIRNLADLSNTRQKLLSLKLMEHLVYILKYYTGDSELMLNVSRILSKLTLHSDCCNNLIPHESFYKSFLKVMIKHESKQDLIVRVGFILGNVTGRYENARIRLISEKYSIETLLNTLKVYFNNDQQNSNGSNGNSKELSEAEPSPNEDVLIKYVRIVANLAISEDVGEKLAKRQDILDVLLKILEFKDLSCEELIINTVVTINNLSFYNSQIIIDNSQKIVDCLMKFLLSNNLEAIIEVFRVFANLSRDQTVRGYLAYRKVNILAIAYLNSNNRELIYIVIGFLINIMTDQENRAILREENGVKKLIELLNEIGPSDWQMSSMICKLFMNYSDNNRPINHFFDQNETKLLTVILKELLDENFALRCHKSEFKSSAPEEDNAENIDDYMDYLWKQDFQPVAKFLIARLIRNV